MSLPAACVKPCSDCPWRRNAAPGWLGPMSSVDWIRLAASEAPIACHQTIKEVDDEGSGDWGDRGIRQCAGAAIYRRNTAKLVRDPSDAMHSFSVDHESVFSRPDEFVAYHKPPQRENPCVECERNEADWRCPNCMDIFCNACIDQFIGSCPSCDKDHGWEPLDMDQDELDEDEWDMLG